jgi:dihydroneopterin aldolase
MDIIFLHDLRVETVIGIWEWERKIRQTVSIDLDMSADIKKAAGSDDVKDTLNYKRVAKRLQQFVGESSFQLVETLAEKIAEIVLDEFDVTWVRVRVNKPGAIRTQWQSSTLGSAAISTLKTIFVWESVNFGIATVNSGYPTFTRVRPWALRGRSS